MMLDAIADVDITELTLAYRDETREIEANEGAVRAVTNAEDRPKSRISMTRLSHRWPREREVARPLFVCLRQGIFLGIHQIFSLSD
jgi:hypothetical protein